MARPSSEVSSGAQIELHTVTSPGRLREQKSTVKSGVMAKLVEQTGFALLLNPLKYETATRQLEDDWLVTVTTVAERLRPPVCEFM